MKGRTIPMLVLYVFFQSLGGPRVHAQASIVSANGYSVHIFIMPVSILPSTTSCPWGYNYNVRLNYSVVFTGSNIPGSLYTLQGYLRCGGTDNFFDLPNNGGAGTVTSTSNQYISAPTCNSATVTSLNCNTATIEINGPGINTQMVGIAVNFVILPVRMIGFTAAVASRKVRVEWQTASESNSRKFIVERSRDGLQWLERTELNAAGHSDSLRSYQYYDEQPLDGISYYRVRTIDLDDRESFSEIRTIQFSSGRAIVNLYPVPNAGNTINLSGFADMKRYRLTVVNSSGAAVYSTYPGSTTVTLPPLKAGIYIVSLRDLDADNIYNLRYVKL